MLCFNMIMIQNTQVRGCKNGWDCNHSNFSSGLLNRFESHGAFLGSSQTTFESFFTPLRGIEELWERVCIVSSNFSEEDCMSLYESMPQMIADVLAAKGYWINY